MLRWVLGLAGVFAIGFAVAAIVVWAFFPTKDDRHAPAPTTVTVSAIVPEPTQP